MASTEVEAELQLVLELERELQTRVCRNDRSRVLELLAPDFTEIGASGRTWDLRNTLQLLESQSDDDGDEIEVTGLVGRVLADSVILVQRDSALKGRRARRTSLWRLDVDGWRQVHHQGTMLHD